MPEQQRRTNGREDDVEIKAPFGWSVRASGKQIGTLLIVLCGAGAILWMLRDHDIKQTELILTAGKDRNEQMTKVSNQQEQLQESMDTVVYVLSIPQEERSRLKLDMPTGLRKKLLSQER